MAFENGDDGAGATGGAADILGGGAPAGGDAAAAVPAGGDAAAAAGGDAGAAAPADNAGADPDWYGQLSAEAGENGASSVRDWAKAAGIKDLNGLAKVAMDNQRALRDSGRVKLPGEGATPEEISAYHKAIGVPETAEGYEIAAPKDADGNDVPLDRDAIGNLAKVAHENGVPKAAFEGLVGDFIKTQLDAVAKMDSDQQAAAAVVLKGWGAEKDRNLAAVDTACRNLGLSKDDVVAMRNAIGADKLLPLMQKIGVGMGEDAFIDGGKTRFGVSGAEARAEYEQLKANPEWARQAQIKGTPENARYNRLNDAMAAEAERKAARA